MLPRPSSVWSTGLSGVHRTVSGARGCLGRRGRSREFTDGVRLKFTGLSGVHRTVRCAPDCPVSQRSARANGRQRDQRRTRGRANGRKAAPDCPVCTGHVRCANGSLAANGRLCRLRKEIGHRTVRCATRQKVRIAFPDCSQRLLAALGL